MAPDLGGMAPDLGGIAPDLGGIAPDLGDMAPDSLPDAYWPAAYGGMMQEGRGKLGTRGTDRSCGGNHGVVCQENDTSLACFFRGMIREGMG